MNTIDTFLEDLEATLEEDKKYDRFIRAYDLKRLITAFYSDAFNAGYESGYEDANDRLE